MKRVLILHDSCFWAYYAAAAMCRTCGQGGDEIVIGFDASDMTWNLDEAAIALESGATLYFFNLDVLPIPAELRGLAGGRNVLGPALFRMTKARGECVVFRDTFVHPDWAGKLPKGKNLATFLGKKGFDPVAINPSPASAQFPPCLQSVIDCAGGWEAFDTIARDLMLRALRAVELLRLPFDQMPVQCTNWDRELAAAPVQRIVEIIRRLAEGLSPLEPVLKKKIVHRADREAGLQELALEALDVRESGISILEEPASKDVLSGVRKMLLADERHRGVRLLIGKVGDVGYDDYYFVGRVHSKLELCTVLELAGANCAPVRRAKELCFWTENLDAVVAMFESALLEESENG